MFVLGSLDLAKRNRGCRSITNSPDGRRKSDICAAPSRKRSGMEISIEKKWWKLHRIFFDGRKVQIYEKLLALGEYAGQEEGWTETLWMDLLAVPPLFEEMVYYLEHHDYKDDFQYKGYSLIDLYVWQMNRYNLIKDFGKNTAECNKETLVLRSFATMIELMKNPEECLKRLKEGRGMDQL